MKTNKETSLFEISLDRSQVLELAGKGSLLWKAEECQARADLALSRGDYAKAIAEIDAHDVFKAMAQRGVA